MPREEFRGKIVVVENEQQLLRALTDLSKSTAIGFDTETRPCFRKNTRHRMALMQLSSGNTWDLIRICRFDPVPLALEQFLKDSTIKKIGLSLRDDFNGLFRITHIAPGNFIDLQHIVGQFGIEELSLRKIYAILFGKKISKRERLSNWEQPVLTKAQQRYAALDAWSCLRIYKYLEAEL